VTTTPCPAISQWTQDPWTLGTPTREQAGENVMHQILDLLEHGRSQVLTTDQLLVIKSYVDEMTEEN